MVDDFDFGLTVDGEIILDSETHDIASKTDDSLRIQLAYNRIKSVSTTWYIDEIGADLEEIVGRPCTEDIAEYGKTKISNSLIYDELWDSDDIYIKAEILNNTMIVYSIYLKIYQSETEDTYSYEIVAEIDLIKGVNIRYGWEPRR